MKAVLIALSALAAGTGAAYADADPPAVAIEVEPGALSSPEGRAELRARIARAARDVCAAPRGRELDLRRERRACIREAVADAEAQLERRLAALNPGKRLAGSGDQDASEG